MHALALGALLLATRARSDGVAWRIRSAHPRSPAERRRRVCCGAVLIAFVFLIVAVVCGGALVVAIAFWVVAAMLVIVTLAAP